MTLPSRILQTSGAFKDGYSTRKVMGRVKIKNKNKNKKKQKTADHIDYLLFAIYFANHFMWAIPFKPPRNSKRAGTVINSPLYRCRN